MLWLGLFTLLIYFSPCASQQRWYLTGTYDNKTKPEVPFLGQTVSLAELCDGSMAESQENLQLLFGGAVVQKTASALEPTLLDNIGYHLNVGAPEDVSGCRRIMHVESNVSFEIYGSVDYESSYGFEVGLYDHRTEKFVEKEWRQLLLGRLMCLSVRIEMSCADGLASSVDSADGVVVSQTRSVESHDLIYSMDLRKRFSMMSHTWNIPSVEADSIEGAPEGGNGTTSPEEDTSAVNITAKVMTFNLWHNNPAAWVFGFEERHRRYVERLSHFADIVVAEEPDVVLVQEVRWDSAFSLKRLANLTAKPHTPRGRPSDVGSQVEHLVYFISAAYSRSRGDPAPADRGRELDAYQVLYTPAMLLQELDPRSGTGGRNEEGVAILVKNSHYFQGGVAKSTDVDYRLLPRWIADPKDDHQRALLHARVRLQAPGAVRPAVLDVYTVHYSLSPRGRAMGVLDTWGFIHGHQHSSDVQVLGGDFNAEPDEHTMQYFTDAGPLAVERGAGKTEVVLDESGELSASEQARGSECDAVYHRSLASLRGEEVKIPCPDFTDAWVWKAADMQRVAAQGVSPVPSELELLGYTFPACNPIKRIDYLMVRNTTWADPAQKKWRASFVDTRIVGMEPTGNTAHLANAREGLGMLDADSPIWASDHFGVVVDLVLHYH